jgi:hypothetical protein
MFELPMSYLVSDRGLKKHIYSKEGHLVSRKLRI